MVLVIFFILYQTVPFHICTELHRKDQIVQAQTHNSFLECDEVRSSYFTCTQQDKVRVQLG